MSKQSYLSAVLLLGLAFAVSSFLIGCSGDTSGGSSEDANVADLAFSGSSGDIDLELNSDQFPVSQTVGFKVDVDGANGVPAANLVVSCNTESGLAIIEPSSNSFVTDSNGVASGIVGCAAPGSWQMLCSVAGVNAFATVICTGDFPLGFVGFPDAGGGTLGGGVANQGGQFDGAPGGSDIAAASISSLTVQDNGEPTNNIDVVLDECNANFPGPDEESDPEDFGGAELKAVVNNSGGQNILITGYSIEVPEGTGDGTSTFNSGVLAITISLPTNATSDLTLPLAFASGGGKIYAGPGAVSIPSMGFRNITLRLFAQNDGGDAVTLTASIGANFVNEFNC